MSEYMISVFALIGVGALVFGVAALIMWAIFWAPRAKTAAQREKLTVYYPDGATKEYLCWEIYYLDSRRVSFETDEGHFMTSLPYSISERGVSRAD